MTVLAEGTSVRSIGEAVGNPGPRSGCRDFYRMRVFAAVLCAVVASCSSELRGPPSSVLIFDATGDVVIRNCVDGIRSVFVMKVGGDTFPIDPGDLPSSDTIDVSRRNVHPGRVVEIGVPKSVGSESIVFYVEDRSGGWSSARVRMRPGSTLPNGRDQFSGRSVSRTQAESEC